jgi:DNA-binding MarR family transcriptional regulator
MHPATSLLRDFLAVSTEFQTHFAAQLGVNPTDLSAMSHLIESGSLGPTELARRLKLTTAAITTSIDRLTALGHVTRIPNPNDGRGVVVVANPDSIAAAMRTLMPMVQGIDEVLSDFTEAEKDTIADYLQKVVATYRAQLPVVSDPAVLEKSS